jgi:hypothetical protein
MCRSLLSSHVVFELQQGHGESCSINAREGALDLSVVTSRIDERDSMLGAPLLCLR